MKCLIAYFSRKGENYVDGKIRKLAKGNTEVVAEKIQLITRGDLFEIKSVNSYPDNYEKATEIAKEELLKNARPVLTDHVNYMEQYNVIFLGYPIWWDTFPMPVFTFLESYDFSGKIILPFCTHEGSGKGTSEKDIKRVCPEAKILPCLVIRGSSVAKSDSSIRSWLKKIEPLLQSENIVIHYKFL